MSTPSRRSDASQASRTYSGRPSMPEPRAVRAAHVAELGRQHDLVAPAGDRPADQLLVGERPVHVGRVEEGHAQLERPVDRRVGLGLVGGPVELGHAHAAQPLGRDLQTLAAQAPLLQFGSPSSELRTGPNASPPQRRLVFDTLGGNRSEPVKAAGIRAGKRNRNHYQRRPLRTRETVAGKFFSTTRWRERKPSSTETPLTQARPSSSYSRRKPSKRRRWPCSSRRIAITMSWVTGSIWSVSSMIRV